MNKVTHVRPELLGQVFVKMSDGRSGMFDIRPYMVQSDFFRELEHESYFRQVRIFFRGIGWPNGQDIGPDTIASELIETEVAVAA